MLRLFFLRLKGWPRIDQALLTGVAVLALAATVRLSWKGRGETLSSGYLVEPSIPEHRAAALPSLPTEALVALVQAAPFRPQRTPAPERYRLAALSESGGSRPGRTSRGPTPRYRLRGIAVLGASRLAILEGEPGQEGARVYRLNDSLDEWRVDLIAGDSIVLAGPDTAVVLKITRPWTR